MMKKECVDTWFEAYDAYHRASDAYNERLTIVRAERERGNWTMDVTREYLTLHDAQSAALKASETLYQELRGKRADAS